MKVIITIDYDMTRIYGTAKLDDKAVTLLSTGKYIIVPSLLVDNDNAEIVELSIIHEDSLQRQPNHPVLKSII
jgi:hypothetical protein